MLRGLQFPTPQLTLNLQQNPITAMAGRTSVELRAVQWPGCTRCVPPRCVGLGLPRLSKASVGCQSGEFVLREQDETISGLPRESGPSKRGPQHPITLFTKACSCPVNPQTRYLMQFFLQAMFLLRRIARRITRRIATSLLQFDLF